MSHKILVTKPGSKETHFTLNEESIINVHSGMGYTIYSDLHHSNIWAIGHNNWGECGSNDETKKLEELTPVKYFDDNNIKIKKICANVGGSATFWISRKNSVYSCGVNTDSKKIELIDSLKD